MCWIAQSHWPGPVKTALATLPSFFFKLYRVQGILEVLYTQRSSAPNPMPLIAAMDLGDCIALLQPWASHGTILEYVTSDAFQVTLAEHPLDAVKELADLVLIQIGGDCALKHSRMRLATLSYVGMPAGVAL